jgi:ABC-type branched-subunit amino acid transport system substrate-binding protein
MPNGVAVRDGAQLYPDVVNAAGGVHGRKVVVRTLDDDNKAESAEANARRLIGDGAFVLFGSIEGGPSTAVMKVAAEARVPFFGPMAGSPGLRSPHQPMVFPVRAEHKDEFRALMQWGRSTGLRTVGFLHADSAVGREHLANVERIAAELGMQVVLPIALGADVSDAKVGETVARISRVQPDMMFNHGSASSYARVVAAAKHAYARTTFVAVTSGSTQIARDLGSLATGMVFAQVVPNP